MANELETLIRQIVSELEGAKSNVTHSTALYTTDTVDRDVTVEDYPIAKKHPEWITMVDL